MKKYLIFILIVSLTSVMIAQIAFCLDGNPFVQFSAAYERVISGNSMGTDGVNSGMFMGYVTGASDILTDENLVCMPNGSTIAQTIEIVIKYIKANPEKWHLPASLLVRQALVKTFPCKI